MAAYKFSNNFFITAIGALGLATLASAGYLLIPGRAENKKQQEAIVQQHERKRVFYNNATVHNADGIMLELLASDKTPESWSGINLQISPAKAENGRNTPLSAFQPQNSITSRHSLQKTAQQAQK
ncbi:MAG: hypothetical protein QXR48_01235 [Candidatus Woesearchaeota archaeon]